MMGVRGGGKFGVAALVLALAGATFYVLCHFVRPAAPEAAGRATEAAAGPDSAIAFRHHLPATTRRARASSPIMLLEVAELCGITFRHTDGSSGRHYIVEPMSTGLATFDYDGDGLIDIYFPNGAPLPGAEYDRTPRHALYKNLGRWRFEDLAERAGVACTAYGLGIAVADYDNDGWPDIFLDNFGPNLLYRNNGDGTFTDVTRKAGVSGSTPAGRLERKVGAGAAFLDIDGDGRLDLYAGNYVELDLDSHVVRKGPGREPVAIYPSPRDYDPVPSVLYRNNGDGTFADVSDVSGIGAHAGRTMGVIAADYDGDGASDLFICNDVMENFLFHNDGRGRFAQVALAAGVAVSLTSEHLANMAVDCADFDHDGRLDFYTTNYQAQVPMLLRNLGDGVFEDIAAATRADTACYPNVTWGCALVDLDNDGHKDIFVANGHTDDNIERFDMTTAYRTHNLVLRNTGQGRFVDVSAECGIRDVAVHASRGVAVDDLDNDGDLDIVVLNSRERPTVLRNMLNETNPGNHWLQVQLRGVKTNRDGVGARVKVVAGGLVLIDEVHSGRSFQSHWGSRLHFGLGPRGRVDRVEVRWIGGGVDVRENVDADQLITIVEGARG